MSEREREMDDDKPSFLRGKSVEPCENESNGHQPRNTVFPMVSRFGKVIERLVDSTHTLHISLFNLYSKKLFGYQLISIPPQA